MLRQALMENGVDETAITVIPDEVEAVNAGLGMAAPGDLLVIFGDDTTRCWKQIIYFNAPGDQPKPKGASATRQPVATFEDMFDTDQTLIRDERGVRLARDISENAD